MAINLESHGLPVAATYGTPVTVQDQQGDGHGQQAAAQDTGYSASSAFEQTPGASVAHAAVQDQEPAGAGDLFSKLSGFIRAVGDVVVQLGEYIRSAAGQSAPEAPPQAPAAPAPLAAPGAPVPQQVLAGGPQASTATTLAAPPRQTNPSLNARPSAPASADASRTAPAGSVGAPATDLSAAVATPRGGARASQSSGYPVLNPLPPYLGDQLGFYDTGSEPEPAVAQPQGQGFEATLGTSGFEGFQGFEANFGSAEPEAQQPESASARPPVQPIAPLASGLDPIAQVQAYENVHADQLGLNNVVPFPGPAARDALAGEASNEPTGADAQPQTDLAPRYSGMVFRPAFYGNLRC